MESTSDVISAPTLPAESRNPTNIIGLNISAGDSVVKGLAIKGFGNFAIQLGSKDNNIIQGNVIEVVAPAAVAILSSSSGNLIGGTETDEANVITNTGGDGVSVEAGSSTGNSILSNTYTAIGTQAIDLGNDDVPTGDDADDADSGANNLQNFPVLATTQFSASGDLEITYSVDSATANSTYPLVVEFYSQDSSDELVLIGSDTYDSASAQGSKTASLSGVVIDPTMSVIATATDNNGAGNTSEFSAGLASPLQADLSVANDSLTATVNTDNNVTFTSTVTNNGPSNASAVTLVNTLTGPPFTFVSATPSQGTGCNEAGGVFTCDLGAIASGAGATVEIQVTATDEGTLSSEAVVTGNEFDSVSTNNIASKDVTVTQLQADVSVTNDSSLATVVEGNNVTFTSTVTNNGPSDASAVTLVNTLTGPPFTFVSATPSQGTPCVEASGVITCALGAIASGASATVEIEVTATTVGTLSSEAVVTGTEFDSVSTNDIASKDVTVTQQATTTTTTTTTSGGGGGGGGARVARPPTIPTAIAHSHMESSFIFTASLGAGNPPNQVLSISNSGEETLIWFVSDSAGWLTLDPTRGFSEGEPDEVTLSVDVTDLPEGTYEAIVTITGDEAENTPQTVGVVLIVNPPAAELPEISTNPRTLTITTPQGSTAPAVRTIEVWNSGERTLNWSGEVDEDWLSISPSGGASTGSARLPVTVTADPTGFAPGTYQAILTISDDDGDVEPQTIAVEFVVSPSAPEIAFNEDSFRFNASELGANPATQILQVQNAGGFDLNWTISSDEDWLTPSSESGTASEDASSVGLAIDISGLEAGTYEAEIEVASDDADNSPQTVTVTLVISPPLDSDNDGTPDVFESGGPNNGDANRDSIQDSTQPNVATLPDPVGGIFVTFTSSEGTGLAGVSTVDNPSPGDAPPRVNFPLGFYEYSVENIARGASAQVVLTLDNPSGFNANKFYKYGPTPDDPDDHWYEFTFDGETGVELLGDSIVLHLVDGQRGDDDLTDNGRIVNIGAPANDRRADLSIVRSSVPAEVTIVQALEYSVTITNDGPSVATSVTVRQDIPEGFAFASATTTKGVCNGDGVVDCELASMNPGTSATVTVALQATAVTEEAVSIATVVSSASTDPVEDNNRIASDISITAPEIGLGTQSFSFTAIEGNPSPLAQILEISNTGSGTVGWDLTPSCDASGTGIVPWLSILQQRGFVTDGSQRIAVGVDFNDLPPGTYNTRFAISDPNSINSCQEVTLGLIVFAALGRPQQSSVNLQPWELRGIGEAAKLFFEGKREEVEADQQPWFVAAGELASKLESDETIRRAIANPSIANDSALRSLAGISQKLGNWGGQLNFANEDEDKQKNQEEQFAEVNQFTFDLTAGIGAILGGSSQWSRDQLGVMQISATPDEALYVFYSRADQKILVHYDTFDGVAGQIDGVIPVTVVEDEALGTTLALGDAGFVYSRRSPVLKAAIGSPGELRVYDEVGRVTGTVNGEITINIPNSTFFKDEILVMLPSSTQADTFQYEVLGTESEGGEYTLSISRIGIDGTAVEFPALLDGVNAGPFNGAFIGLNEAHVYDVDWDTFDVDRGWSWKIDTNGDGLFDNEFPPPFVERSVVPEWVWPEAVIAATIGLVLAFFLVWILVSWFEPIRSLASKGSAPLSKVLSPVTKVLQPLGINMRIPRMPTPRGLIGSVGRLPGRR